MCLGKSQWEKFALMDKNKPLSNSMQTQSVDSFNLTKGKIEGQMCPAGCFFFPRNAIILVTSPSDLRQGEPRMPFFMTLCSKFRFLKYFYFMLLFRNKTLNQMSVNINKGPLYFILGQRFLPRSQVGYGGEEFFSKC